MSTPFKPLITSPEVITFSQSNLRNACRFESSTDKWECTSGPVTVSRSRTEAADGVNFSATPLYSSWECFDSFAVKISPRKRDLIIDWSKAVAVVNGRAIDVVPGFARRISSSLEQKESLIPAGTSKEETLHNVSEGECLVDSSTNAGESGEVQLLIDVIEGEEKHRLAWRRSMMMEIVEADVMLANVEIKEPARLIQSRNNNSCGTTSSTKLANDLFDEDKRRYEILMKQQKELKAAKSAAYLFHGSSSFARQRY